MSDDDDDYMSSAFLDSKEDIRPGLTHSRSVKRKYAMEKKKEESRKLHCTKPRKVLEEEQRAAGLDRALTSDNKGFALLQKMGYKPGMKLGKQVDTSTSNRGLEEPIKVKIKADRGGLGREQLIREKIAQREKKKVEIKVWKEKETAKLTEEYRQRMRDKVVMKQVSSDLRKSQRVCEQLDSESGVEEPLRPWFWFSNQSEPTDDYDEDDDYEEEEEEESALEPEEQLSFVLDYLRSKYCYCVWCGVKYEDDDDMYANCPGTEKDDHE